MENTLENTLENKSRFFAMYYGQKVLCIRKQNEPKLYVGFDDFTPKEKLQTDYLELKPLSSITDEDRHALIDIMNNKDSEEEYTSLHSADYLRSKGYALPFMGLSVEKQIEYNWIKLTL
jgi:hypothetical protein